MGSPCKNCRNLQNHSEDGEESEAASLQCFNTTVKILQRSAAEGCSTCQLISAAIKAYSHDAEFGTENGDKRVLGSFLPKNDTQIPVSITLRSSNTLPESSPSDLKIELYRTPEQYSVQGQTPTLPAIGRRGHLSENPLSDYGLYMIAAMIDKCSSQHTSCKLTESDVLPRRLLDVSETVRLREFSTETTRCSDLGNYLTLSHCYGTDQSILHTTTQTLKAFEDSISWSELPRTFQDAISLTRALGLRWLWIDSLCILQDSEEEKLEESARMDEIFGNSYFTIAATSAADSSGGLFFPKPRLVEVQVEGDISVFVREQPTHFNFESDADRKPHSGRDCHPFSVAGAPSPDAPLLGRAWPYAERLLARRVLHFTKSELIFECREGYECECGRLDNQRLDSPPTDTVKQKYAEISGASSREDTLDTLIPRLEATSLTDVSQRDQALDLWSHIVSSFTSKDITHGKDRLIAISSVAKAFSTSLRSGYAAGQWTFNVCNLLWYPNDGSKSHRPSYKVPTWSWASVEGSPIFFDNETAMDLSCAVEFKSGDGKASKWSPMSGGTLDLTAALATEVKFTVQDLTGSFLTKNGVSVSFTPDVSPPGGKSEVTPGETLICIFVSMTFRSSILGLVLKQNPSSNVYRRVGRLECTTCEGNVDDNDAEALFGYWFPDVSDMTKIDDGPHKTFVIE